MCTGISLQLLHLYRSSFCRRSLVTIRTATMGSASILTVTFHILAWICTLQPLVMASSDLNLTHYSYEIRGGENRTFLLAAGTPQPNLAVGAKWGSLIVYDNMMRAGPNSNSTLIGRITGTATGIVNPKTTGDETRVQLVMHHVFTDASIYNGSYIDVLGIFFTATGPWKMVVPGCTGALQGYSGYAICTQISQTTGFPIYLEYQWDFYLTKP